MIVALLLGCSLLCLLGWTFAVPIFEAPDEPHHWMYARYIHDHWRLPPFTTAYVEGSQAPLYYLLIAPLAFKSDFPHDVREVDGEGHLKLTCPPRFYENCRQDLGRFGPIRMARLITALFSVLTVWFTFLAAREVTGSHWTGLLAGGLLAFLPEFAFRGMNISNDAMVTCTSAAATYCIVRLLRRGFTWNVAWAAALCAALAFLSKVNGLVMALVLAGVIFLMRAPWPVRLKRVAVVPAALLIAAPWVIRNQVVYGDPLGGNTIASVLPVLVDRKSILSPYFTMTFLPMTWHSFVGVFGWMNVAAPGAIYEIYRWIGVVAVCGLLWRLTRRTAQPKHGEVIATLAAIVLLTVALLVQLNLMFTQPQGRLLFPALPALAVLAALGFEALPGWNRALTCCAVLAAAGLNLFLLAKVIVPLYWTPLPASEIVTLDVSVPDTLMTGGPAGPLNPGGNCGQTFTARKNNLTMVEVEIATYSRRLSRGFLNLRLRKSPQAQKDIASVAIPAPSIQNCSFVQLTFPPIPDSAQQSYYLLMDTNDLGPEDQLTVFRSSRDVYPGGGFWVNGVLNKDRDTTFRTYYRRMCPGCNLGEVPEESYFGKAP